MTIFTATSVLWTKEFSTGRDTNETSFKGMLKAILAVDVNAGKLEYTEDEILALFEQCYTRAGSKTPAKKAKLTWTNYAMPSTKKTCEHWFK